MNSQAREILTSHFTEQDWVLRKATEGLTSTCYIATGEGVDVFIKLDADATALHRVADLGIAPKVLASGSHNGSPYVVQEFLYGTHPDRKWFSLHLPQLADLIQTYHRDPVLATLLSKGQPLGYTKYIDRQLKVFEVELARLSESSYKAELLPLLGDLKDQACSFDPVELVPTHADPNYNNFLLVGERVYLLDWDGVSLSDPMRDVGPLLWWYVPQEKWPEFFAACSMEMDEQVTRKVYWWAARQSLWVALWFARKGYMEHAEPFITDFKAALHRQANPHA